ncbi:hypothetical protein [Euzebya sp.]|uniref:hypothetical protein n=1 Tax=Euzebya sp. TaxID=1971409 RepID=UPI003513E536
MTDDGGESGTVDNLLGDARAEVARLVWAARVELIRTGTAIPADQIATITDAGIRYVPSFQVNLAAVDIIARLRAYGMDDWAIWDWAETPNGWLHGRTPAAVLAEGDVDAVVHAIAGMFQEDWVETGTIDDLFADVEPDGRRWQQVPAPPPASTTGRSPAAAPGANPARSSDATAPP